MTAITAASHDLQQVPASKSSHANGNHMSYVKTNNDDKKTSAKFFEKTIDQKGIPMEPTEAKTNQSERQIKQIATGDLSDRDFLIQKVMNQKGVSEEVAQEEIDFFY